MKNVIIIGAGFIASHLRYPIIGDYLECNDKQIRTILNLYKPDVVINAIGYCGVKNIDDCEYNKEKTIKTNLTIPTILATECDKLGIHMIHIGSGCIFFGPSPATDGLEYKKYYETGWKETDTANPESFYSQTKYACDLALQNLKNTCILRIRMPISIKNSPRNLINKLLSYKSILNHKNSVTFLNDLSKVIDWAVDNNKTGIYHVANPEPLTHPVLLEEYKKYDPKHNYEVINEDQLRQLVSSPRSNCILNTDKLKSEGFIMTPTREALETCMAEFCKKRGTL